MHLTTDQERQLGENSVVKEGYKSKVNHVWLVWLAQPVSMSHITQLVTPLSQSHKHQVTPRPLRLLGFQASAAAVLASSDLQCLVEEPISHYRAAQQQEAEILILFDFFGFLGGFLDPLNETDLGSQ